VLRVKPQRDTWGRVVRPLQVAFLVAPPADPTGLAGRPWMVLPQAWIDAAGVGDEVRLRDARERKRKLRVVERLPTGWLLEADRTIYFEAGLTVELRRKDQPPVEACLDGIPPVASHLELRPGDALRLTAVADAGGPARHDDNGREIEPATIPCAAPEIFGDVQVGEPILFDDGKIAGRVEHTGPEALQVRIERTPPKGGKLRPDKGINLPETRLRLPALTADDRALLDFVADEADLVGLSFVHTAADLLELQRELDARGADRVGVILKIENQTAFDHLPSLLMAGLRRPPVGVMVARGDLGVEVGFERLAEVQEEILWLCEAAHIPVVWATQVLESLAKRGIPSRAEVTDAAMSGRAECVMLNKGPYIVETVEFLRSVLDRMRDHHHKKTPMLRKLKVSEGRFSPD
jgi:pyruvate kinase